MGKMWDCGDAIVIFCVHIRICYIMYSILYCIQHLILLIYFIFYCMVCIFRVTYESYLKLGITNSASSAILYVYRFFSWSMQCIQQIHTRKLMASKNEGRGRAAKKPRRQIQKDLTSPEKSKWSKSVLQKKRLFGGRNWQNWKTPFLPLGLIPRGLWPSTEYGRRSMGGFGRLIP